MYFLKILLYESVKYGGYCHRLLADDIINSHVFVYNIMKR